MALENYAMVWDRNKTRGGVKLFNPDVILFVGPQRQYSNSNTLLDKAQ